MFATKLGNTVKNDNQGLLETSPADTSSATTNNELIKGELTAFNHYLDSQKKPVLKSFSKNGSVGEIPIQSGVNNMGAFTAAVPINIIPGIAGMQPNLSLGYNSLSGNGLAGFGWNLTGISTISRRGLNMFQDGKTAPTVTSDTEAELLLDGKRLIFDSEKRMGQFMRRKYYLDGSNKSCIVYAVIIHLESRIDFFEVVFPNGLRGRYRSSLGNSIWQIDKMSDRHGNYISYNYTTIGERNYISSISYGGNSVKSTPHFETISFSYETRNDLSKIYDAGTAITTDQRLTKISNTLGTYTLNYQDAHFSLLNSIGYSSGEMALNPLTFLYGTGSTSTALSKQTGLLRPHFTDANKDNIIALTGKYRKSAQNEGLVVLPKKNSYEWGKFKDFQYEAFHSMYSENDVVIITPDMEQPYYSTTVKVGKGFRSLVTMENQDAPDSENIILINADGSFNGYQTLKFTILTTDNYADLITKEKSYTFESNWSYNNYYTAYPMNFFTGDFNGDGKQEVCALRPKSALKDHPLYNTGIYFFDLNSSGTGSDSYIFKEIPFEIASEDVVVPADFDGDGKTDLVHFSSSGTTIYTFDRDFSSTHLLAFNAKKIAETNRVNLGHYTEKKVLLGDINGDGKTDIAAFLKDNKWMQCLSNGTNGFDVTEVSGPRIDASKETLMHDFNGDGQSDIVNIKNNALMVYYSRDASIETFSGSGYSLDGLANDGKLLTVDLNSSNHNRTLIHIKNGEYTQMFAINNEKVNSLLTSINNSMGIETEIYYGRIDGKEDFQPEIDNICTYEKNAEFPYQPFRGCYWAVGRVSTRSLPTGTLFNNTNYHYTDPVIHRQGLGFCGFRKVYSEDYISGEKLTSNYDPLKYGILTSSQSIKESIKNEYEISLSDKKEVKVNLSGQERTNMLTGAKTTMYQGFDEYDNITWQSTGYSGITLVVKSSTEYINYLSEDMNIIGLVESSSVSRDRQGMCSSEKIIEYNSNFLPETITEKMNYKVTMVTSFDYDQWSNVTKKTEKPFGIEQRALTSTYDYTENGRYLTTGIDPIGSRSFQYNEKGLLKSSKDYRELETEYEYDPLGRQTLITFPDGVTERTEYTWQNSRDEGDGIYCVSTSVTGKPSSKTTFDALGRDVRSMAMRADGQMNYIDKVYDGKGRLEKISMPFTGSYATLWSTYAYDQYDRIKSITEPSGKATTYDYSGLTVRESKDGMMTSRTYDAIGLLVKAEDPAGTITYTYRGDDQPQNINVQGIHTFFSYDDFGRKTAIYDPSSGNKEFRYNDAPKGDISSTVTEILPTGKYTITKYDKYNRVSGTDFSEFSTTYSYTPFNELASEISENGTSKLYEYDPFGRIFEIKENVATNKNLTKTYSYSQGNISQVGYRFNNELRGGTYEDYIYTNGHLSEILFNGVISIWKLKTENELGQPTEITTGPLTRTYAYDSYGLPRSRTCTFNDVKIQNFTTLFDAVKGNLAGRGDYKYGKFETFEYDGLNRLNNIYDEQTGISGIVPFSVNNKKLLAPPGIETKILTHSFKYSPYGNIESKSDIGNFQYKNSSYQLTNANPTSNAIPLRSQNTYYTSFDRPDFIQENDYDAEFTYNSSKERVKMELKKNGVKEFTRYYMGGCYEEDEIPNARFNKGKLYIGGDKYSAPAVYIKQGYEDGEIYYICRDYLGSITHITDSGGSLVQELSYDAWGRLRNPETLEAYSPGNEPELILGRGYTSHEHLTQFGLINMNARLYDPALGRFLSPDPYISTPDFTQGYNRYSYCLNNPLRYTDEDGELPQVVVAALIGGAVNLTVNLIQGNIHSVGQGFASFGVGAAAGTVGMVGGPMAAGAIIGVGNSAINQGFTNGWNNIDYSQVAMNGLMGGTMGFVGGQVSGFITPHVSGLVSGISGPAVREAVTQSLAGAGSGFVLGTGGALFGGASLEDALASGGQSAALGFTTGAISGTITGLQMAKASGVNPITGAAKAPMKPTYNFSLDPNGNNITLYRGTTGSEGSSGPLFMTTDKSYATTYVKNGGRVVEITIPKSTLNQMLYDGTATSYKGANVYSNNKGIEYMFNNSVKSQIVSKLNY